MLTFSKNGTVNKPAGTAAIDNTPNNLLGKTRNKLNVGKKYHSGKISRGVAKGFAGSPNGDGSKTARPITHAKVPKIQSLNKQNIEKKVEILKCPKYFSFTCSSNYCTKNNKTCESIKNLHYMIRAYSGLVLFEKELNRYFKFIKMISNCSTIKTSKLKV